MAVYAGGTSTLKYTRGFGYAANNVVAAFVRKTDAARFNKISRESARLGWRTGERNKRGRTDGGGAGGRLGMARSSGIVNGSSKSKSKSDNRKEGTLKPVIYWYPVEAGRMRAESTRLAGRRFAGSCLLAGDVYALGL